MKYNRWPKRDPIKNYFPLPNEVFSLGLSAAEIAVYAYLLYCEDRQTYQCYPSFNTIGRAVGMCKNTVMKHVSTLEEKGLITTESTSIFTKGGMKKNGNLLYNIRPIHEAVQIFHDKQLRQMEEEADKSRIAKLMTDQDGVFRWEEASA